MEALNQQHLEKAFQETHERDLEEVLNLQKSFEYVKEENVDVKTKIS